MTKQQVVGLAVRVASIFLILYIVRGGASFIYSSYRFEQGEGNWFIYAIIFSVLFLSVAILIYKYPLKIAGKLLPSTNNEELKWKSSLKELEIASFIILGMYVLVSTIPSIFHWVIVYVQIINTEHISNELPPNQWANLYTAIVQLILGILLVFGATAIREVIYKIRYLGYKK